MVTDGGQERWGQGGRGLPAGLAVSDCGPLQGRKRAGGAGGGSSERPLSTGQETGLPCVTYSVHKARVQHKAWPGLAVCGSAQREQRITLVQHFNIYII